RPLRSPHSFPTRRSSDLRKLHEAAPDLEVEGEMHADAALDPSIRERVFPHSLLSGAANLLVMPTLDAANIAFNIVKVAADGLSRSEEHTSELQSRENLVC